MTDAGVEIAPSIDRPSQPREALADRLATVRERTFELLSTMTDEQLTTQPEPVMGVVAWDVGHIGSFENQWLVDALGGDPVSEERTRLYDPFEHPRSVRGQLELPSRQDLRAYLTDVRKRALDTLEAVDLEAGDPLVRHGFVHDMIVRHEQQHQENILITLQLMGSDPEGLDPYSPPAREPVPDARVDVEGMVEVPGARFELGTDPRVGTYDNEWPAHEVEVDPFRIDAAPVTNREYLAFIEDGGYDTEAHWSEDGWMIRQALELEHPRFWSRDDEGGWQVRRFDRVEPLRLDEPVCHVSYYEAEAYAAWAGKRLPTEAEWELAASWDPRTDTKHRFPWGDEPWTPERANLRQRSFQPAPVGAYPDGVSPLGCHQMAGDVWEWTRSVFSGYPGFEAFPYPEYSEAHFDSGYQVLKGGAWSTWPDCAHATFRNWHQPDHQHIFAGFRCVEEAGR